MPKIVARKEDWIKLGYQLFTEEGEHGIVIDNMSKKLTCNRSSFYWHFKTKKAFIAEVIGHWVEKETQNIIRAIDKEKSAKERFRALIMLSFKQNPYLDFVFYLKKYALSDEVAKKAIYTIDGLRKNYVFSLLVELGYSPEEAKIKTSLFYKYLIGYHETIRYRKQTDNYIEEILVEIKYFIPLHFK